MTRFAGAIEHDPLLALSGRNNDCALWGQFLRYLIGRIDGADYLPGAEG
jgi:hypothetical protein